MHPHSGSKTTRNIDINNGSEVFVRQQAQLDGATPRDVPTDEYLYSLLKSSASSKLLIQSQVSPAKKLMQSPTTPKISSEYYLKAEKFHSGSESVTGKFTKAGSSQDFRIKAVPKKPHDLENMATSRVADPDTKSAALKQTVSPRINTVRDTNVAQETSTVAAVTTTVPNEERKALSSQADGNLKSRVQTEAEAPTGNQKLKVDASMHSDRSTGSGSHIRSSVTHEVNWENLKLPVTPQYVMQHHGDIMSPYEREEILNFPQIFYISGVYQKILAKSEQEFDDERGDYLVVKNDHIRYRYECLEMLGRGSFGQVVKVFDHKRKEYAAVKVIRSPKKFHFQAKIEIRILKYMMDNYGADYNIIGMRDFFTFRGHVCLVFDMMDVNLYDLLKKNKFKGFPLPTIRKFAIQVLYALKFLRHHKIIHCDLKPENILLRHANKTGIKLIDFGSSCFEHEKLYTYIQSRFYRSPEIILGLTYSTQIDMWSFGCLLCELYLGYPIFAGDSERDQLLSMFEVLGVPSKDIIKASPRKSKFFEENCEPTVVPNTKGKMRHPNGTPISGIIKQTDDKFLSLVMHCLEFDQNKRFTPDQALSHEWIIEGLPPQLQAQHLKFIRDTTDDVKEPEKTPAMGSARSFALASKDPQPVRTEPNSTTFRAQESIRFPTSSKAAVPNLNIQNTFQTHEDASTTVDLKQSATEERMGTSNGSSRQKRVTMRKITATIKEKPIISVRGIQRQLTHDAKALSTRNLIPTGGDSEAEASPDKADKRGSFLVFSKQIKLGLETVRGPKKIELDATPREKPGTGLVAWETPRRQEESQKGKRGTNLFNLHSPKVGSVERLASRNGEKDALHSPYKNVAAALPSLRGHNPGSTALKK